jgi:hypothetical protein
MIWLRRTRLSLSLVAERRVLLLVIVDCVFLFIGLMLAFGGTGRASEFYRALFLFPSMILGIPMLSECVALERRSGTLDLALTSPGARFYFERRMLAVVVLMIAQGFAGIIAARLAVEPFPILPALVQVVIVSIFIAAIALNWAVRLSTSGAVIFATAATCLIFMPWLIRNPIIAPAATGHPLNADDLAEVIKANLVFVGATTIFYLYALQRLMKPEAIIS